MLQITLPLDFDPDKSVHRATLDFAEFPPLATRFANWEKVAIELLLRHSKLRTDVLQFQTREQSVLPAVGVSHTQGKIGDTVTRYGLEIAFWTYESLNIDGKGFAFARSR
ncbi:MAG TPA: hypothetical protein VMB85_12405 [Bryobacteraceae bacterium]|nr:hypothetical protein [Bryobacteraceae bacterium]